MPISDIVDVSISTASATAKQAGFGVPLILGYSLRFPERVRYYDSSAGMLADGFLTTDAEYLAAQALESQSPRVQRWAVGRGELPPTMRWAVTPVAVNLGVYKIRVKRGTFEETYSFTADASATVAEIIAGLLALINADTASHGLTASDQTTYLRLVQGTAGAFTEVEVLETTLLGIAQENADPGVATDLAAILAYDADWYALLLVSHSKAEILAAAAWVESNKKLLIAHTQDSAVENTAAGGGDVADSAEVSNYGRTAIIYHRDGGSFADAAWAGARLPTTPGAETWKFAKLAGVATNEFTATQLTNLRAKNANWFYEINGLPITAEGKVAANEWIDVVRGIDWTAARQGEEVLTVKVQAGQFGKKIPFTDAGVAVIKSAVFKPLREGVTNGLYAEDPAPSVSAPLVADVSAANKSTRNLPDVFWTATLAGAIHKTTVRGAVSI